jgi:serine/threonine protein phosphatase 1
MMWIRNAFLDHRRAHGKLVVHGHTITDAVDFQPNRINIDTGAFMSGRLSCVVLEGTRYDLIDSVSGMTGSGGEGA